MFLFEANMRREEEKWKQRGKRKGAEETTQKIVKKMKEQGFDKKVISSITGLKLEKI